MFSPRHHHCHTFSMNLAEGCGSALRSDDGPHGVCLSWVPEQPRGQIRKGWGRKLETDSRGGQEVREGQGQRQGSVEREESDS